VPKRVFSLNVAYESSKNKSNGAKDPSELTPLCYSHLLLIIGNLTQAPEKESEWEIGTRTSKPLLFTIPLAFGYALRIILFFS